MRPFREDPRFQDFARALNMFEYWEKHGPPDGHALVDGRLVCIRRMPFANSLPIVR